MSDSFNRTRSAAEVLGLLTRSLGTLTPELKKAATHVLEHSNLISVTSVREMAQQADVKPNTLVRMARAIGFEGYEDFRKPFREEVIKGRDDAHVRDSWLQSHPSEDTRSSLYADLATASLGSLERLFSETTSPAIKAAADAIAQAPATYVLGTGMVNSIAAYFAYLVGMAGAKVIAIPRDGLSPAEGLQRAARDDVLVAMAFKPYQHEVVEAVSLAGARGLRVIGVSDSPASPIMTSAIHRFVVPIRPRPVFPSSLGLIALLEAIIAFMITSREDGASSIDGAQHPRGDGIRLNEGDR